MNLNLAVEERNFSYEDD